MSVLLGKLQKLSAKKAWPHEAQDFTPWLLENADALGEVLGMDLLIQQREYGVGSFSLDLIGIDQQTKETVIIENQFGKSDHSHLGQLLTYSGGTDPVNIIWIAEDMRYEHRAALDWLNERTDEKTRFFAVELSVVKIEDSMLAPHFEVVVEPNDWQKKMLSATSAATKGPKQEKYREFWGLFLDELKKTSPGWTNTKQALAQNWMNLPSGVGSPSYVVVFTKEGPRVEIYFSSDVETNKKHFEKFQGHRSALEDAFGTALKWEPEVGKKACRISCATEGDFEDEKKWPDYIAWFVQTSCKLKKAIDAQGGMAALLQ